MAIAYTDLTLKAELATLKCDFKGLTFCALKSCKISETVPRDCVAK